MFKSFIAVTAGWQLTVASGRMSAADLSSPFVRALVNMAPVSAVQLEWMSLAVWLSGVWFGAYVAARLAPRRPIAHAVVIGAGLMAYELLSSSPEWTPVPAWETLARIALVIPAAWLGGEARNMAGKEPVQLPPA